MALNFGLLNTNAPAEIANSVSQGRQDVMREQMAQQQLKTGALQQESTQMQLDQAKRDREALLKMQSAFVANGKSPDMEKNFTEMMNSGIAHYVDIGVKGMQKLQEQKQFASVFGGDFNAPAPAPAPANALAEPVVAPTNAIAAPVNAMTAPTPAAAVPTNAMVAPANISAQPPAAANVDVTALRRRRDMLLAMGTTQSIAAAKALDADIALASKESVYHNVPGVGLVDPRSGKVITPSVETAPTDIKEYEYAKKQGYKGTLFDFKREMANAGRAAAQPSAPVAVIDPATGKQIYVSREEALRGKMTPASGFEGLSAKDIQKREASYPQATGAVKSTEQNVDSLIVQLEKLKANPGLEGITGLIAGRTPNLTSDARSAQADLKKIKAEGTLGVLTALRAASKTGGALGNTSDKDIALLENAFGAFDQTQDTADFQAKIDQAIHMLQRTKQNARETYDLTYQYKSAAPETAPRSAPAAVNSGVVTHPQFPGFSVGKK
jgi:hypothetical protein